MLQSSLFRSSRAVRMASLAAVIALLPDVTHRAFGQDDPTAASIIQKHIDASGGEMKLKGVKSLYSLADLEMAAVDGTGTVESYASDGKFFSEITLELFGQTQSVRQGINGDVVWQFSSQEGAPRVLEGAERQQLLDEGSSPFPELTWIEDFGDRIKYEGEATIGGKKAHELEFTDKEGNKVIRYFDSESGLQIRIDRSQSSPMGDVAMVIKLSDYKEVEGIKLPHTVAVAMFEQDVFTTSLQKVEINGDIDNEVFALPDEIEELIK